MQEASAEGPRLCVVDDDEGTARLEQRELRRKGYDVRVCTSSQAARELASRERIDCWLVDQHLTGGTTGLDLIASLQASGVRAPFVLVTGTDDPDVILMALRAGVRDFVHKGEGFVEKLVDRVERVMRAARAELELQRAQARAELEAERRRELEDEIDERRRAEDRARAALGKLREIDRRKNEFLAMLGHELRNPLAPIRNAVEVLRAAPEHDKVQWASDIIARQVDQMRHIIDDLLDVARIMNSRLTLRSELVTVQSTVEQAIERIQPEVDRRRQTLSHTQPDEALHVEGDSVRIVQAIANLLDNASKYSPEGSAIEIDVAAGDDWVEVAVRDYGNGLDPEQKDSLFDLFVQGQRSPERSEGGLGLGLTLVRQLAHMHGGEVRADSDGLGHGSTFTLRLPRVASAAADDDCGEQRAPARPAASHATVLVVDDNVDAANSAAMLLGMWGLATIVAHDGDEALRKIDECDPEVVMLDIGLPKRDGHEVIREARARPDARSRLWIAVTGYGQESDREKALAAGFDVHLTKPVPPDMLRDALGPVLGG